MKVTVLVYLESENARSHDVVADQVVEALAERGHEAAILGVHGDVRKLIDGLTTKPPDFVFNLMEMFGKNLSGDIGVVGLLDLLGMRYTGGGPGEFYLRGDKALSKKVLAFEKILYPDFAVFSKDANFETGGNLRLPLFVKPLCGDASIGINSKSLVSDAKSLMKQVIMLHEKLGQSALAEEYIEGREFYVGVLGNHEPQAFPPIEVDFSGLPAGAPRVLDAKAKWAKDSVQYKGTKTVVAEIPDELRARLQKVSVEAYRALRVRDYGRVDLRLTDTGDIYVIEVNASCYLEKTSEFAVAAAAAGVDYVTLVNRVLEVAQARYAQGGS
jgi:D-alanine-D-alanine ligase